MVSDQNAAEKARAEATKTSALLAERNKEVDERRSVAEADLSKAEPALLEAKQAVRNIKKAHLDELKASKNTHFQKSKPGPARVPTAASVGSAYPHHALQASNAMHTPPN